MKKPVIWIEMTVGMNMDDALWFADINRKRWSAHGCDTAILTRKNKVYVLRSANNDDINTPSQITYRGTQPMYPVAVCKTVADKRLISYWRYDPQNTDKLVILDRATKKGDN